MHESVSSSGTPSERPSAITSALCILANGVAMSMSAASPIESARDMVSKNSGVASGNGLPASGPMKIVASAGSRREYRRLGQKNDVAAFEVDVLVGCIEPGRLPADRPVAGRVDVAHVEAKRLDRLNVPERSRCQQSVEHRELFLFPCQPDADVDRHDLLFCRTDPMAFRDGRPPRDVGQQHRAVESARAEDCRSLTAFRPNHYDPPSVRALESEP